MVICSDADVTVALLVSAWIEIRLLQLVSRSDRRRTPRECVD